MRLVVVNDFNDISAALLIPRAEIYLFAESEVTEVYQEIKAQLTYPDLLGY